MNKKERKEIIEATKNRIAQKFNFVISSKNTKIKELECQITKYKKELSETRDKLLDLEIEKEKYKDWTNRLLEFTEIPRGSLEQIVKDIQNKNKEEKDFQEYFSLITGIPQGMSMFEKIFEGSSSF